MKTTVETLCIYSATMRSTRITPTIVSVGDEVLVKRGDEKFIGTIIQISTMGHCWIKHGEQIDAVPYNYIFEKGTIPYENTDKKAD